MVEIKAKVDTGAYRSSIDRELAEDLGLLVADRVLYYRHYKSSLGKHQDRPVIGATFWLKGEKITTAMNVADRAHMSTKFLIGRMDLQGFSVKISKFIEKNEK